MDFNRLREMVRNGMTQDDHPTRERIFAAAEPLFAAQGFGPVALRRIAAGARVPVGGIAYHFGSKAGLYRAIWERRMAGVDVKLPPGGQETDGYSGRPARLRQIVDAFFAGPRAILRQKGGHHFIAIMVREAHDPTNFDRGLMAQFVEPNASKIHAALAALFPELLHDRLHIGFLMTISAMRLVIEQQSSSSQRELSPLADIDGQVAIVSKFVMAGWLDMVGETGVTDRAGR